MTDRIGHRDALDVLIAKDAIRELVLLYSRGVDRKDAALLRTLYTADATDTHGDSFDGNQSDYIDFLERSFPHIRYSGHHVCNHLVSVVGDDRGEGEVYAIAWHVFPDGQGGWTEDMIAVRYIDRYAREEDGRWRFAQRIVSYDMRIRRPFPGDVGAPAVEAEPSYSLLASSLFQRS